MNVLINNKDVYLHIYNIEMIERKFSKKILVKFLSNSTPANNYNQNQTGFNQKNFPSRLHFSQIIPIKLESVTFRVCHKIKEIVYKNMNNYKNKSSYKHEKQTQCNQGYICISQDWDCNCNIRGSTFSQVIPIKLESFTFRICHKIKEIMYKIKNNYKNKKSYKHEKQTQCNQGYICISQEWDRNCYIRWSPNHTMERINSRDSSRGWSPRIHFLVGLKEDTTLMQSTTKSNWT